MGHHNQYYINDSDQLDQWEGNKSRNPKKMRPRTGHKETVRLELVCFGIWQRKGILIKIEILTNYWTRLAITKCVASITLNTTAKWAVVQNATIGISATQSRTRIDTSLIEAGLGRLTVGTVKTFWPTIRSCSDHIEQTTALSLTRCNLTLRIRSTWCRITRIGRQRSKCCYLRSRTRIRSYKEEEEVGG